MLTALLLASPLHGACTCHQRRLCLRRPPSTLCCSKLRDLGRCWQRHPSSHGSLCVAYREVHHHRTNDNDSLSKLHSLSARFPSARPGMRHLGLCGHDLQHHDRGTDAPPCSNTFAPPTLSQIAVGGRSALHLCGPSNVGT